MEQKSMTIIFFFAYRQKINSPAANLNLHLIKKKATLLQPSCLDTDIITMLLFTRVPSNHVLWIISLMSTNVSSHAPFLTAELQSWTADVTTDVLQTFQHIKQTEKYGECGLKSFPRLF